MADTTRVQLELPQKAYDRLLSLKARTEASSYSEVCKNALKLYLDLVDRGETGKTLITRDAAGNVSEVILPGA